MEQLVQLLYDEGSVKETLTAFHTVLSEDGTISKFPWLDAAKSGLVAALQSFLCTAWNCHENQASSNYCLAQNFDPRLADLDHLAETDVGKDPKMIQLALSCLYHMCNFHRFLYPKYFGKEVIRTLLSYVIPDPMLTSKPVVHNRYFQYSLAYTAAVSECLSCRRGLVKVSVDSDIDLGSASGAANSSFEKDFLKADLKFYEPSYVLVIETSGLLRSCRVQFGEDSKDQSLSDHLVSKGLAWPQGGVMVIAGDERPRCRKPKPTSSTHDMQEALITHVLRGNFFWMILGESNIRLAEKVAKTLKESSCKLFNIQTKKNDAVAAAVTVHGASTLVRARVLNVTNTVVTVFALDSGKIYCVSQRNIYILPQVLNLVKVPPLAVLATLSDIYPAPLDARATDIALGILGILSRWDNPAVIADVLQSGVVAALPCLVSCPDLEIAYRALDLSVNLMSHRVPLVKNTTWQGLIPGTLSTLRRTMRRTLESKQTAMKAATTTDLDKAASATNGVASQNGLPLRRGLTPALVLSSLACLADSMFMSWPGKKRFFQLKGLDTVLQVNALYKKDSVQRKCLDVLSNFVSSDPSKICRFKKNRTADKKAMKSKAPNSVTGVQAVTMVSLESDSSDGETSESEEENRELDSSGLGASRSSSFNSDPGQDVERSPKKFYVRGSKVPFVQDTTHELLKTTTIGRAELAILISGMLNTGQAGVIYLGIDPKDSTVLGTSLPINDRDELGMGIDEVMLKKISPSVLHLQFEVVFTPVVEVPAAGLKSDLECGDGGYDSSNGDDKLAPAAMFHLDHSYVVEIHLKPLALDVLYCCNDGECYYRSEAKTRPLDCQMARHLIVLEEEARYVEKIAALEQELEELQMEDAALG